LTVTLGVPRLSIELALITATIPSMSLSVAARILKPWSFNAAVNSASMDLLPYGWGKMTLPHHDV
jgi:hypothetical protein